MKLVIEKGTSKFKRYKAIFYDDKGKKLRTVQFGDNRYEAYIDHKDKERRSRYLDRHRKNENWNNYLSAGALSRWILWGASTSIKENIKKYKTRFKLT